MKQKNNNKLAFSLLQLQNLIKRDPESYHDEFYLNYRHYESLLEVFKIKPHEYDENLSHLIMFVAQVSSFYKEDLKDFPDHLMSLLRQYSTVLEPSMRMCLCRALILMRNRGVLLPIDLIKLCFELLRCKDKILRKHLQVYIISDIKNLNMKHKNVKVNSALQNFMFQMLDDSNATAVKMSLDIMIELYRRNVWKDAKCVNAIATACFSKVNKVLVAAIHFFLGKDDDNEDKEKDNDSSESEDDTPTVKEVMTANQVNKKSRKRMKILKRTKKVLNKSKKKKNKEVFDFSAIHLLNDPQGMAEKLFVKLQGMNERYEIKMLVMDLISRLVGVHQLILLNFYPFLIRYLKPHQRDVTKILLFAAQASHEYVPPDVMDPLMKTIANNFITERNAPLVMAVGLNAVREICVRCPLAIEHDLLQDFVQYKTYKNKNVQMAANSLIQLYRQINPKMLQRKFRNRPTESIKELNPLGYGAVDAKSYIPGSETLSIDPSNDESKEDPIKEEEANDSDDSWINVSHSDDDIEIDSDDDGEEMSSNEGVEKEKSLTGNNNAEEKVESVDRNEKAEENQQMKKSEENISDKEKAMVISQSRILSQEEFRKLKVAQVAKQVKFTKGKKRALEETNPEEITRKELVSIKDIEKLHKKVKEDKEARIAAIKEGREGREKFGARRKVKQPFQSKTQKQNNRNKNFMMIKHKVRSKQKRSFKDKQLSLRNALLKRKKNR